MTPTYDAGAYQSRRRHAIDSAELLIRSRVMRIRVALFCVGFVVGMVLCWITRGVQ